MWDMKLQLDKEIELLRPDIVVMAKEKKSCLLIDVACLFNARLIEEVNEKIEKYRDLYRVWHCRDVQIIPVIIDALGTVSKRFVNWVNRIEIDVNFILLTGQGLYIQPLKKVGLNVHFLKI